jgi:hypothetical protein
MKGILFAGDSFTWGEGLHLYSDLPDVHYNEMGYNNKRYTPAHKDWINANRFSRRVANHFETFDLVRYHNGGDNGEIFDFIDNIETEYQRRYVDAQPTPHRMFTYKLNDFDYIIIQLTDIFRKKVLLPNGKLCNIRSLDSIKDAGFNEYLRNNFDNKLDNFISYYLEKFSKEVEYKIKKYENLGIKKCFITTWHSDILPFIKNNSFLNERLITFYLGDKIVESIWDLQSLDKISNKYPEMTINQDPYFLKKNIVVTNSHTSLTAHKLMANSIIKKIEENEQSGLHTI